jgi:2-dehydropantoate 2-reductase
MKILMFGAGVIGTIYGYALSKASNQVIHYVRPGKKKQLEKGVDISLMDGRFKPARQDHIHYDMNVVEDFKDAGHFDLLIASVRHYQLNTVLPIISKNTDSADVLIFNGNWEGIENVNRFIPKSRYLWGFPVAGGGYKDGKLDGALLDEVRIGEMGGTSTPRLERIKSMFEHAHIKVDIQPHMLHWLWVHFAINCGIIGSAMRAGSAVRLLNSVPDLRKGILAGREALEVCKARGVDVKSFADTKPFYLPALLGAVAVWFMMKTNKPARKIFETHTAIDELQEMYFDLLKTGDELNVAMPNYMSMQKYVRHPAVSQSL